MIEPGKNICGRAVIVGTFCLVSVSMASGADRFTPVLNG